MRWSGPGKVAGGAPQARGEILRLRHAGTASRGPLNADVRAQIWSAGKLSQTWLNGAVTCPI